MINAKKVLSKTKNYFCTNKSFIIIIVIFILIMSVTFVFSPGNSKYSNLYNFAYAEPNIKDPYMMQTDALLKGQVSLDIEPSDELLRLENPYDLHQRDGVDYLWDFAFYNGKYYSYFGIVPVVLFLLPFRLITGMYLSSYFFSFLLNIGAVISLAFLYKTLFNRFFKYRSKLIFSFGLIALLFGSNLLFLCARSWFYEIAYCSGLMFVFLSLNMLLKIQADNPHRRLFAFLSGLFFALSVGCRPNYCIYFIIYIPILFSILKGSKIRKEKTKLIASYISSIIVIGCCLGIYNYVRFDSFFQFGAIYQLTVSDIRENSLLDFPKVLEGFLRYFLHPMDFCSNFPYVYLLKDFKFTEAANHMYSRAALGLLCYPVTWNIAFLPFVIYKSRKRKKKVPVLPLIATLLLCCIFMIYIVSATAGIAERYTLDFQWVAILASILIFFCFFEQYGEVSIGGEALTIKKTAVLWFCISVLCSAFICLGIGILGEQQRIIQALPFLFQ